LLPNIKLLKANAKSTSQKPRRYGMDNTVALWINDANNNGVIYGNPRTGTSTGLNTGEFVYAYATMGRGGRNIYALDITNRSNPKMLWQIIGGTTSGFEKLGQTWSVPVKTRIQVGSDIKDVLIFGGGYDTNQDDLNRTDSTRSADSLGNAIYIVDAKTGAKIWSAGNDDTHDLNLAKMQYGIPSKVRVIDINAGDASQIGEDANQGKLLSGGILVQDEEKLADQIFVGDMGGQVWRLFINHGSSGSNLITAGGTNGDGVFASVANDTPESARRFYHEPDVALLKVGGSPTLTVNIGSGYSGHQLNKTIEDRFYSFRTDTLFTNSNEGTLI
jgi:type IV pilus assembly protein PilY1